MVVWLHADHVSGELTWQREYHERVQTTFSRTFPFLFPCKWTPGPGPPLFQDHLCSSFQVAFKEEFSLFTGKWNVMMELSLQCTYIIQVTGKLLQRRGENAVLWFQGEFLVDITHVPKMTNKQAIKFMNNIKKFCWAHIFNLRRIWYNSISNSRQVQIWSLTSNAQSPMKVMSKSNTIQQIIWLDHS